MSPSKAKFCVFRFIDPTVRRRPRLLAAPPPHSFERVRARAIAATWPSSPRSQPLATSACRPIFGLNRRRPIKLFARFCRQLALASLHTCTSSRPYKTNFRPAVAAVAALRCSPTPPPPPTAAHNKTFRLFCATRADNIMQLAPPALAHTAKVGARRTRSRRSVASDVAIPSVRARFDLLILCVNYNP